MSWAFFKSSLTSATCINHPQSSHSLSSLCPCQALLLPFSETQKGVNTGFLSPFPKGEGGRGGLLVCIESPLSPHGQTHTMNSTQTASGGSERRKSRERTEDGWTQGLALRAAMMMYPFALWDGGGRVGRGTVGRFFLGVVGRRIGQIHLHVIRHFFQEVRGNQTTVAVDLTLWTEMRSGDISVRATSGWTWCISYCTYNMCYICTV